MKAWPSGLAVKSAGSDRGIGNVRRGFVRNDQAIWSFSLPETPTRGKSPGQISATASTSSGCRAAAITASFAPQLIPAIVVGSPGFSARKARAHSTRSRISRPADRAWPRSAWFAPEPRRSGNDARYPDEASVRPSR